ncbi:hypothetical protein M2341_003125 [Sphingobium sp. B7D2B]|uniref:hypothetical protein n=1 Tax=Sphingobium sp. B7D2B TaxID=2940583 RepID=UPI002224714A|nr:hypothetical protein [Sphingobium sp. B7D2B]MCW2367678.1 hypothetical protein [Sphingobium sp. B7D2B]
MAAAADIYAAPAVLVDTLHDQLYRGDIVRFRTLPAMRTLADHARAFVEQHLAPHDPERIHAALDRVALAETLDAVQRAFSNDAQAKNLWRALFEVVGLQADDVARDRLLLRFQPPVPADNQPHSARSTATVGFHRDSWGTNLAAQVNWWAPVWPITSGRTFAFLPELFDRPIPNDSADFDLAEVMARRRTGSASADRGRMAPRPLVPIDAAQGTPVLIAPGEIIAFSAQHAHVGVENRTGLTRISLETRTVRISDHLAGRGAPNVDGRARWIAYALFRRLSDGRPLADVLGVSPLMPFGEGPTVSGI